MAIQDESAVASIRHAIDNTTTVITGNETNIITIANTYPIFGTALPQLFVMDNLITFSKTLQMGTEIYIKKDGVFIKTVNTKSNIKNIWLSDLLDVSRELLYTKVSEVYELTFVYNQYINNQIIIGELTNFTYANIVANQLTQGLYEIANAKTLDILPVTTNDCDFTVVYDDYNNAIKTATLDLGNGQSINLSLIEDVSTTPSTTLVKLNCNDIVYNVDINMVFDSKGISDYISLIRDFARRMATLNNIV